MENRYEFLATKVYWESFMSQQVEIVYCIKKKKITENRLLKALLNFKVSNFYRIIFFLIF